MNSNEKITKALSDKGYREIEVFWEPISYNGPSGREGGWYIEFDTENFGDDIQEAIEKVINSPEATIYESGILGGVVNMPGIILAYNKDAALAIIKLLPDLTNEELYGPKSLQHCDYANYEQI